MPVMMKKLLAMLLVCIITLSSTAVVAEKNTTIAFDPTDMPEEVVTELADDVANNSAEEGHTEMATPPDEESENAQEPSVEATVEATMKPAVDETPVPEVEVTAEPSVDPTVEPPVVNPPEVIVLPEWEMDGDVLVIPYTAEDMIFTVGWEFDGVAKEYRIQTAPVVEDEEEILTDVCTCVETEVVLPVVDYAEGVYTLYITAGLEDGTTATVMQKFMLAQREMVIDENAPKTPHELADYFDMTLEELAEVLGLSIVEIEALSESELLEVYV